MGGALTSAIAVLAIVQRGEGGGGRCNSKLHAARARCQLHCQRHPSIKGQAFLSARSVVGAAYAILAESSFSQDWQDILAWNGDGGIFPDDLSTAPAWTWIVIGIIGLAAVVALVNQVLLFFYWKPSRLIYFVSCVLLYPAMLFMGLWIFTPFEYVMYEMAAFISGITLALLYYSPVAERFK
jgi:hypothetical protein